MKVQDWPYVGLVVEVVIEKYSTNILKLILSKVETNIIYILYKFGKRFIKI